MKTAWRESIKRGWAAMTIAATLGLATEAWSQGSPPNLISYQGYLVNLDGKPLGATQAGESDPTNYDVQFSIYDAATGGNLLWREQQTLTVDKGYFSVFLGEGTPVDVLPSPTFATVFSGATAQNRFIQVDVRFSAGGDFTAIMPRLRMLASPYAFLSSGARAVLDPTGASLMVANQAQLVVNAPMQVNQGLTVNSISGNGANLTALNASAIASGTISADRIPGLDASKVSGGVLSAERIPGLDAGKITAGTINPARVPVLNDSSIPNLNASKITSGQFHPDRISWLRAGQVTDGSFHPDRIPGLDASKITSGTLNQARIPRTINADFVLRNGTPYFTMFNTAVAGDVNWGRIYKNTTAIVIGGRGFLHTSGERWAAYDGDSNWDFSSDARLKKDIVDVEPMLDRTLSLKVRRYRWLEDGPESSHKMGVIAQEVQPLFPDLVTESELPAAGKDESDKSTETYLNVAYTDFGLVAIKALQELKERQDAEISALRGEVEQLKQLVETLTANRD